MLFWQHEHPGLVTGIWSPALLETKLGNPGRNHHTLRGVVLQGT